MKQVLKFWPLLRILKITVIEQGLLNMPRCYQCGNTNAWITPHDSENMYCSDCYHENFDDEMDLACFEILQGHEPACALQFNNTYKCICKKKEKK